MKNRNFCYKWGRKFFELCWFWKKFCIYNKVVMICGEFFCGCEFLSAGCFGEFGKNFFWVRFFKKQEFCHFERSLGNLALFFGEFGGFCH